MWPTEILTLTNVIAKLMFLNTFELETSISQQGHVCESKEAMLEINAKVTDITWKFDFQMVSCV